MRLCGKQTHLYVWVRVYGCVGVHCFRFNGRKAALHNPLQPTEWLFHGSRSATDAIVKDGCVSSPPLLACVFACLLVADVPTLRFVSANDAS